MTEDIERIENIVAGLNAKIFAHLEGRGIIPEHLGNCFTFEGNGEWQAIKFMDMPLWDSESDERDDHPDHEEVKEDLEVHVLRVAQALLKSLGSLSLEPPSN